MILISVLLLIVGFVLLVQGADWFVEGAASIAKRFRIPTIIIGMTIVAFGTSAPELAVSLTAAIKGANSIALGNVIGSNMFNLLVVIGLCSLIAPINVKKSVIKQDYPFSLLVTVILFLLSADFLFGKDNMILSRLNGLILIVFLVLFMFYSIKNAKKERSVLDSQNESIGVRSLPKSILWLIIGLACVIFGGQLVVNHATTIARFLGISDTLIGLTIVAIGTSLPELVTSLVATRKGDNDMAIGNVIGSNILNIVIILGISSSINPISVTMLSIYDLIILIAVNILIYLVILPKYQVKRSVGFFMVLTYISYTTYIILR